MPESQPSFRELFPKFWRLFLLAVVAVGLSSIVVLVLIFKHREWHGHLLSIVSRAWDVFVAQDIGSTSRGVINGFIEAILALTLVAAVTAYLFGWKKFSEHVIETAISVLLVGGTVTFIVYGTQLAWEIVGAVYRDHVNLSSANWKLQEANSHLIDPKSKDEEIANLKRQVSETQAQSKINPTSSAGTAVPNPTPLLQSQPLALTDLQTSVLKRDLKAGAGFRVRINVVGLSQDAKDFADELQAVFQGWEVDGIPVGVAPDWDFTSSLELCIPHPEDKSVQIVVHAFDHAHIQYTKNVSPNAYFGVVRMIGPAPPITINIKSK